jgi:chemotaxis protein methyltransferase CheR
MKDVDCVEFLQWCLPALRFRWKGFRKVRGQVCKRIVRRVTELGLSGLSAYRSYIDNHPEEWSVLDSMCRITISRFWRDRGVFETLRSEVMPTLARNAQTNGEKEIRCWSAGCSSGEEPYTLQIIWKSLDIPALPLGITATDMDRNLLERAKRGDYQHSSLKDLPEDLVRRDFYKSGDLYIMDRDLKRKVRFLLQDIRREMPEERFHLILCRNLVFTYYNEALQRKTTEKILERLLPGGFLIIGTHESLPEGTSGIVPYKKNPCIYQRLEV